MDYEIIFNGDLQEMATDDIINYIDPTQYTEIRKVDKNPLFKVFSLGHEGESTGKVIGVGEVVKKWVKNVIQMMHDKIKIGTKVFLQHKPGTNEHAGRLQLGKLVGKAIETLKNGLNTLGIIYINPEHRELKTDIASIEAKFTWNPFSKEIRGISDITGIALGDSDNMQPGFEGAILQAQLQEFHDNHIKDGIGVKMTLEEIKAAIRKGKFTVEDTHDRPAIESVEFVKNYKEANKRLYDKHQAKETEYEKLETLKTDYETKITDKDKEITGYKNADVKRESVKILDTILEERTTLTDKQRSFIKLGYPQFTITDIEKVKDELNKFADSKLDELKKVSEVLGIKVEEDPNDKDKTGVKSFHTSSTEKIEYDEKGLIKGNNPFLIKPKK